MIPFLCPHCHQALLRLEHSYRCENNHCFDIAKQGYVNLLCANTQGNHGDDKGMVQARADFLNTDAYSPFSQAVCNAVKKLANEGFSLLDAGCGEGYYTVRLYESLREKLSRFEIHGIDVSKNAVIKAARREKGIAWSVGSVYSLPYDNASFSAVLSLFSPFAKEEFMRVLQPEGYLILGFPLEDHLWELKSAIYDTPYRNQPHSEDLEGFRLVDRSTLRYSIHLDSNEMIRNLFSMTPYAYNTSPKDLEKLHSLSALDTTVHFSVSVYQKNS